MPVTVAATVYPLLSVSFRNVCINILHNGDDDDVDDDDNNNNNNNNTEVS
jgi:hypothetical protein